MTRPGISRITISLHFLLTAFVVTRYFRSKYLLTSPLISVTVRDGLLKSYYFDMIALGILFIVSLSLYLFSKYLLSILVSIFAVLFVIIYYLF
jgi:hypothetical protein